MANGDRVLAIGLMSGTSMDGIDAALMRTDGRATVETLGFVTRPLSAPLRAEIAAAMAVARKLDRPRPDVAIDACARLIAECHAESVAALLAATGQAARDIAVIGFHGQTVAHRPPLTPGAIGWTWQIGDSRRLARLTGIDVIGDFRVADMAAGGQGAPLAPLYQQALVARARATGVLPDAPAAVVNIGGVANVAWIGRAADALVAFDTGPGNALIDDWVSARTGGTHDAGGALAASGVVRADLLAALTDLPWFDLAPPKSLDRNAFDIGGVRDLSPADGAATLTAFTAETIARATRHMPEPPALWLVTGGGRHNPTLMAALADRLPAVAPVESVGWNGDALEAEAFAWLAVRALTGLPLSLPTTTGVAAPQSGGLLYRAQ